MDDLTFHQRQQTSNPDRLIGLKRDDGIATRVAFGDRLDLRQFSDRPLPKQGRPRPSRRHAVVHAPRPGFAPRASQIRLQRRRL